MLFLRQVQPIHFAASFVLVWLCYYEIVSFLEFWRTWVLFVGPLIHLFWTSGDVCPVFQSQGDYPCLLTSSPACSGFLWLISLGDTCWSFGSHHGSRGIFNPWIYIYNILIAASQVFLCNIDLFIFWMYKDIKNNGDFHCVLLFEKSFSTCMTSGYQLTYNKESIIFFKQRSKPHPLCPPTMQTFPECSVLN